MLIIYVVCTDITFFKELSPCFHGAVYRAELVSSVMRAISKTKTKTKTKLSGKEVLKGSNF